MNLIELRKALDTFQKEYNGYLELTEKILPGQPKEVRDFIESMLESLTLYNLFINRIKDDLATFKVEYDGQLHVPGFSVCMSNEDYDRLVHVPRKQLEGLTTFIEANSARVSFYGKGTYDIAKAMLENRLTILIQEILSESQKTLLFLEGSEHHFLTVGEAREKLKEVSKEAKS